MDADDLQDLDEETQAAVQASDDSQIQSAFVAASKGPAPVKSSKSGSAAEKKAYHEQLEALHRHTAHREKKPSRLDRGQDGPGPHRATLHFGRGGHISQGYTRCDLKLLRLGIL